MSNDDAPPEITDLGITPEPYFGENDTPEPQPASDRIWVTNLQGNGCFRITVDVKVFREMLKSFSVIVEELAITVNTTGIEARAVDPAHVCMMAFESDGFVMGEDDDIKFGIELRRFMDAFPTSVSGDIQIYTKRDDNFLHIDEVDGKFSMKSRMLDCSQVHPPNVPDLPSTNKVPVIAGVFKEAVNRLAKAGDLLTYEQKADTEEVVLSVEQGEWAEWSYIIADDVWCEDVKSTYSVTYLKPFGSLFSTAAQKKLVITLDISGDNLPFKATVPMSFGELIMFLAPRIDGD